MPERESEIITDLWDAKHAQSDRLMRQAVARAREYGFTDGQIAGELGLGVEEVAALGERSEA